ncbi:EamA family transporter, partial [Bacillus thuringiensis]|nr:EamA family transporter [Bacillus thuringiensis]
VGFAGYGFLVFYGQQLAGPSGAIHAAMIQSLMPLIALSLQWITKNRRPQNYTFLCMFVALLGVILVISKGNIELLFGAASHLSTNI